MTHFIFHAAPVALCPTLQPGCDIVLEVSNDELCHAASWRDDITISHIGWPGGAAPRWLIADGTDPRWGPDGKEVYYRSGARLMAARIDTTAGIRVLSRRLVIEPFLPPMYDDYDIHPDGRTLVMVRPAGSTQGREVTMVLNWFTELRRLIRTS